MTSSQWLDIAVIGVALIAAISGWRSGALGSLMSFVGVLLGAIAGVMLAPHVVSHIGSPRGKLFAALLLILALVVLLRPENGLNILLLGLIGTAAGLGNWFFYRKCTSSDA